MRLLERKQDTRRKIEHGGLVKKAGLDKKPTNVLYGLLLEASEKMSSRNGDIVQKEWALKGDIALTMDKKVKRYDES